MELRLKNLIEIGVEKSAKSKNMLGGNVWIVDRYNTDHIFGQQKERREKKYEEVKNKN